MNLSVPLSIRTTLRSILPVKVLPGRPVFLNKNDHLAIAG
jgi:hypothetical protein